MTLEHTISLLAKSNATKQIDLNKMQIDLFDNTQKYLDESVNKEKELLTQVEQLRLKKYDVETKLSQHNDINEKLSNIVAVSQKNDDLEGEGDLCKYDEMYYAIAETIQDYEQLKLDYAKVAEKIAQLGQSCDKDEADVRDLIVENKQLTVEIYRNDCIIRLREQQNNYVEQQFDLILNQLPWEPLTDEYINELRQHTDSGIRDLAEVLKIQASDIEDLYDSIGRKRQQKLEILEDLLIQYDNFIRKREEARMRTKLTD